MATRSELKGATQVEWRGEIHPVTGGVFDTNWFGPMVDLDGDNTVPIYEVTVIEDSTRTNGYTNKSDAVLARLLADARRRARTARGSSAAQSADRAAARIQAELDLRASSDA